jgi:hypothetical protein
MNVLAPLPPASQTIKRRYIVELNTGETEEVEAVNENEAWALACDEWKYWPSVDQGRVRLADEAVAPTPAANVLANLAQEAKAAMNALADRIDRGETVEADTIRQTLLLAGCTPQELQALVDLRKERRQALADYAAALEAKTEADKQIAEWRELQRQYQDKSKQIEQLVKEAEQLADKVTSVQAYARLAMQSATRDVSFAAAKCKRLGVEI